MTRGDDNKLTWELTPYGPTKKLDVSGVPRFRPRSEKLDVTAAAVVFDSAILLVELLIVFALAFAAFIKYDPR